MTLKTAVDSATLRVVGNVPAAVFSSEEQVAKEMADLSTDVAVEIAESYDWRPLTKIARFVGDGATDFFPFPADYERMTVNNGVRDMKNWFWGYFPFDNVNDFLMMKENGFALLSPGGWIILDGGFNFVPAPSGTATFPYISKNIVRAANGDLKPSFTADDDTFLLSERLLTLGLVWRWKSQKNLEFGVDEQIYKDSLSHDQYKDRGQRSVRHGTNGEWSSRRIAWPYPLGPGYN